MKYSCDIIVVEWRVIVVRMWMHIDLSIWVSYKIEGNNGKIENKETHIILNKRVFPNNRDKNIKKDEPCGISFI